MLEVFSRLSNIVIKLKDVKRSGWKKAGVFQPESVAEHTYHVILYSLILCNLFEEVLDKDKVLKLAVIHDLAEAITGDIPSPNKTDKHIEKEKDILIEIVKDLKISVDLIEELFSLKSLEALVVKLSDIFATIDQGIYYINQGYSSEYLKNIVFSSGKEIENILNRVDNEYLKLIIHGYIDRVDDCMYRM